MKIFAIEGQINTVYVVVYDDDCALLLDSGCAADVEKSKEASAVTKSVMPSDSLALPH